MLPIPRFNYRVSSLQPFTCDTSATFPVAVSTPVFWFRSNAATASTDTDNTNTVNASSEYSRIFDFGTKAAHLNKTITGASSGYFKYANIKNTLTTFKCELNRAAYNYNNTFSGSVGVAGQGTFIIAGKTGYSNDPGYPTDYPGNWAFQARNANTQAYGFRTELVTSTIFGDIQSYGFNTFYSTPFIRVVSVASAGNPTKYTENGVTGTIVAYDTLSNQGSTNIVGIEQTGNLTDDTADFYECMYWETPLSATDCDAVESYLKQKWCISY